jgi:hypothetical protein
MINNNFVLYGAKIAGELGRDVLMFPVWWYTRGLLQLFASLLLFLKNREKSLALFIWIKNVFRPMYGQTDWQGKLISIGMRIIQIIFRSLVMLFWLLITALILIFWVSLPLIVIYEIFFQLT